MAIRRVWFAAVAVVIGALAVTGARPHSHLGRGPVAEQRTVQEAYGRLPMSFEPNVGQFGGGVAYVSRGRGYSLALRGDEAALALRRGNGKRAASLSVRLVGARRDARARGEDRQPGVVNYLLGRDRSRWRTGVPTFGRVRFDDVYPGVAAIWYGNRQTLEYDLLVAPHRGTAGIRLLYAGATRLRVDSQGDLRIALPGRELRQRRPVVYQELEGRRRPVAGSYVLRGPRTVGFRIGHHDSSRPLVIDPVLPFYATYLGGSGADAGEAIDVDAAGNAYIAGWTFSADFPLAGPIDSKLELSSTYCDWADPCPDAFVTKLNAAGTAVVYSTYVGGDREDRALDVDVDANGNAYVTGGSNSGNDFPTVNAWRSDARYGDAFVFKLDPTGQNLVYSTWLGAKRGRAVTVDGSGAAYVAGAANGNAPVTPGAAQESCTGGCGFVTKVAPSGSAVVWSTYVGETNPAGSQANDLALDTAGNVYVTGTTWSSFPTTPGAISGTYKGYGDAYVAKLDPSGSAFLYSTLLGGSWTEDGTAVAVDAAGDAYVAGTTRSSDFPTTPGAWSNSCNGWGELYCQYTDAFVTKVNPTGTALLYSTFFGGSGDDVAGDMQLDGAGNVYLSGATDSANFPVAHAFQTAGRFEGCSGAPYTVCYDAFASKLNPDWSLGWSTYVGGDSAEDGSDAASGLALDGSGNVYVTGSTSATDFPTLNPMQAGCGTSADGLCDRGAGDAFAAKLGFVAPASPCSLDGHVLTVAVPPGGAVTFSRSGSSLSVTGAGACPAVAFANVATVNVVGSSGDDTVTLDLAGGPFTPGARTELDDDPEVEFTLSLGAGSDTLVLRGGPADDVIELSGYGVDLNDDNDWDVTRLDNERTVVDGGAGADTLWAVDYSRAVTMSGGGGNDVLSGGRGADVLHGGDGNDYLDGWQGNDAVYGDAGNDALAGGYGNDVVDGGDGNDRFDADYDPGADVFQGGPGVDSVLYLDRTTPVSVKVDDVAKDGVNGEGDDVRSDVEQLHGGEASDDLVGGAADNTIFARDGVADTIACGGGVDTVVADELDDVAADCETLGDGGGPPPPENDDFENAAALSSASWIYHGANIGATKQLGEPNHAGFAGGHSVWFRWTAARDGRARVTVTGATWDTLLGVYTGANVGALTQVAANDDAPYGSQVSFTAAAGTRYWIAVDGKNGATGTFDITAHTVASIVPNDDFADAQVLSGASGSVTGTLAGATTEPFEPSANRASIWYRFTAPQDGALTLDLTGSAYNMPLGVYSGASVGALTVVPADQSTYRRTVGVRAGVTYSVQVSDDSYGGVGRVALAWSFGVPVNDNFAKARWINNWSDSTYDTNVGATKESGEPNHAGQTGGHSVWFRLTAYTSQPIELHTLGSTFDTVLAVYTGLSVGALTLVAENDDLSASDTYSFVRFTPVPGRVYSIAVDGKAAATGSIYLHQFPGSGSRGPDFFDEARQLTGAVGSVATQNTAAGKERNEPDHAGNAGGASVWSRWTAPASGTATIDTTGSAIDTLLAVYTGDRVDALTPVAANDNDGGGVTSKVSFPATVGTTYRIAVDGKSNGLDVAEGAITLNWSLAAEKNPPSVSLTAPAAGSTVGGPTTISASANDSSGVAKVEFLINGTVWFTDATAPYAVTWDTQEFGNGPYTLAARAYDVLDNVATSTSRTVTVSTPPDTLFYSGPSDYTTSTSAFFSFYASRSGTTFACSLDGAPFAACSQGTTYNVAEGAHTFLVRASDAGGPDPTPAAWTWTVLQSSNDMFAAAKPISGDHGSVHGTVLGATKEPGEPNHGGLPGGTSVWYRWTAPASYRVQFDSEGSEFDTLLGVYTGSSVSGLTTVASDDNSGSDRVSRVVFDAVAGTTYRLAVDRVYGVDDMFQLRWASYVAPPRPPNDDFANAQALSGTAGSVTGSNAGATKEPLEPTYVGGWIGGASVWYRWTAPASGPASFDTAGSRFESVVAVYTGSALGGLTLVAESDDVFQEGAFVTFDAVAGTTYRILVDGEGFGATGAILLNWHLEPPPPPNDLFANAQVISGESGSVTGTTVGAGREYNEPSHVGNPGGASIWYAWTAPQSGAVTADTIGSDFDTTVAIYEGDTLSGLIERASDDDSGGGTASRASWDAVAGHTYRIVVDGYSRAGVVPRGSVKLSWTTGGLPPDTANPTVSLTEPAPGAVLHGPATLSADASDDVAVARVEFLVDGAIVGSDAVEPYSIEWNSATAPSGPATVTARAVDTAGKTATSSRGVTIDNTPPDTTITSGPAASTIDPNARFEFTANEPASFECKLDAVDWWFCSSPQTYSALTLGPHTFQVRAIDAVGQPDATPASWTWTVTSASAPTNDNFENATQLSGAWGGTSGTNIGATWQAGEPNHAYNSGGKSVWYRWQAPTNGPVVFESSGDFRQGIAVYTGSVLAALTLVVYDDGYLRTWTRAAFDATAGTTYRIAVDGAYGTSGLFTLNWGPPDTTPPETSITAAPSGTVASRTATFAFDSSEAGSTFECALDAGSFAVCTSPQPYWSVPDGGHTFRVRAIDRDGNVDATPATVSWTVDATPPETTIDSGPAQTTTDTDASFAFSASEPGASFQCSLDGAPLTACSSPKSYAGLALGSHTFEVRGRDAAGNVDPTPAAGSWTIQAPDTTPPETTIGAQPPALTNMTSASFSFSSSEAGSTFRCRLDGASFTACTSPKTYTGLGDGVHTFEVAAVDAAANVDPTPASATWRIDATPPETTIDSGPAGSTTATDAAFSFSSEPGATFECSLDGAAFATCSSSKTYSGLTQTTHTFAVRARDLVGNVDATPAARTWTVVAADTSPPETTIASGPAASTGATDATFVFSSSEPGSTFVCRLDAGTWSACSSPQTYVALGTGPHTFEVRASDAAGNVDQSPAAWSWTVTVAPPPPPGGGSAAPPDLAASLRTNSSAARVGQRLTLTAVVTNLSAGAATGVEITFGLSSNARLVVTARCSAAAAPVCAVGDLAGGAASTVHVDVRVIARGALVLRVAARAANGEANAADNETALNLPAAAPLKPAGLTRRGTSRADVLRGTAGDDRLYGRGGNDRLYGRGGGDRLDGGRGADLLVGGSGRDVIACGPGFDSVLADRFDRIARDCESVRRR